MRIPLLLLALASVALVAPVSAGDLRLPPDKPTVGVSVPDAWQPEFTTRGIQAQTGDGDVHLTIETTMNAKEMAAIIDKSDSALKLHQVKLDRATRRNTRFTVNDFPAEEIRYIGIDDQGSVTVTFTFVTIHESALVITYLATAAGYQAHQAELGKIIDSIKALKPSASPAPAAPAATAVP